MRAAGVARAGGPITLLELPDPRPLRDGEILLRVHSAGVGNWDELVRTGGWDTGARPPMALGVEAAGTVARVSRAAPGFQPGDRVATHALPLPDQGCWAELFIAAAAQAAPIPAALPWDVAGALPVPALTADQALTGALGVRPGESVLVHGAGGVTGGLLVQLATHLGARVIATGGPHSMARLHSLGAASVLDYHQPGWPGQTRSLTGGGADAAVNAARAGAADALQAVRPGGRLATITGDPPPAERAITVTAVQVQPDGPRLAQLARLFGAGELGITVGGSFPLDQAGQALAQVRRGAHGTALVLRPASPERGAAASRSSDP
ncbi:MAG TPA: NADP-dependent oxidoreductase [Streptosporangiaceae bacterium]|nr:NADP-dependent oxidoreductase [Streptosporangiaceae bacterium]